MDTLAELVDSPREVQSAPMTLERAYALNSAMVALFFNSEGLREISKETLALLRKASLLELAQAGALVKEHEERQQPGENGRRSHSFKCDDRLVAAIYAFLHFTLPPASSPFDDDYVILKLRDTNYTHFLISGARESDAKDDEDEDA
ncbi:MAG: hypothetical protein NW216_02560 [Hyphomicrobium sp.]|nr:hypothetical protein [Hyphomicrobium sp.]